MYEAASHVIVSTGVYVSRHDTEYIDLVYNGASSQRTEVCNVRSCMLQRWSLVDIWP